MVTAQTRARMLAASVYLDDELTAEIARLYDVEDAHQALTVEHRNLQRQHHRLTVVAGEIRSQLAAARDRIAELCPEEIVKARRDAHLLGAGFYRVTSLGRHRYGTERLDPSRVTVRDDGAGYSWDGSSM